MELSRGGRSLLQGRGESPATLETEGQMLQRVMPGLMGLKNLLVLNDEAHHCYREKPGEAEEEALKGDDRKEAEKNTEAARLWISGLETVGGKLGINRVIDLSATPFFLRGSGYAEGTLFPWTMCDFSLMDAIECGIVKLPRVPVADNIPGGEMPKFRNLWEHIREDMPKKGRGKVSHLDPLSLPVELQTALEALYGHYQKTFEMMQEDGFALPPCFIVVCNNISTSKLVHDYISGFHRVNDDGSTTFHNGRLELFRNFDEDGSRYPRPRTLLINSEELESGEALDKNFRDMAAGEIEQFRREIVQRTGDRRQAEKITDQDLLREVMNTVGKEGRLGDSIRCVVSVSMLTEGWDANTVSHVLGVRAFGTQLLCEQVVGRALRRQSYDLNEKGRFNVEYADVLGIPFDFTAKPVVAPPKPPQPTIQVRAMRPERDALEIRFPRVAGYRVELPEERLEADFNDDSALNLTPDLVGPSITRNQGIIGEGVDQPRPHLRTSTLLFHLTDTKYRPGRGAEAPSLRAAQANHQAVARRLLVCKGGTIPPSSCTRSWPTGLRAHRRGHHEDRRPVRPYSIPIPSVPRPTLISPLPSPVPDRFPPLPHQLGRPRQRLGAEFCRVAEPISRSGATSRTTTSAGPLPAGSKRGLPAGLHRPRGRRPGHVSQGVPKGGRQGQEGDHGHLGNNHGDYGRWPRTLVEGFRTPADTGATDMPNQPMRKR